MTTLGRKLVAVVALTALLGGPPANSIPSAAAAPGDERDTVTPIKHLIVIIGENRTFDNLYGTYVPRLGQQVGNLLSRGIVRANGSPGRNKVAAEQFQLGAINPVTYFISTTSLTNPDKTPYAPFLPTPEAGGAPPRAVTLAQLQAHPAPSAPPFDAHSFSLDQLQTLSPEIAPKDLALLTTGATGLTNCAADASEPPSPCAEPDTRTANFDQLPNTVFQITGPTLAYDSYT